MNTSHIEDLNSDFMLSLYAKCSNLSENIELNPELSKLLESKKNSVEFEPFANLMGSSARFSFHQRAYQMFFSIIRNYGALTQIVSHAYSRSYAINNGITQAEVTELRKLANIIIDDIPDDKELAAIIYFLVINC